MQNNQKLKAFFALLGGLAFMSFAAIFVKAADAPGMVTTFYRMAVAAVILVIPFTVSRLRSTNALSIKGIILAILAGICFGLDMWLWSTGVVLSNATIPTLTANLAPLWVGIGTVLIFKKRQKLQFWLGIFVALGGMILMIHRDIHGDNHIVPGALLGIGAGMFYATFYLLSESGRKLLGTLDFLFISTLSSAVILGFIVFLNGYSLLGYSPQTYLLFTGIGVGVQVIGWYLISFSQGFLPATTVAPTLLGQPVLTFVWAALLLNEQLSIWHIAGGIIVVAGIYWVHYHRVR